ncbi:S24 family peptidase [Novosphingobium terrae]|uniref:S24 family peptidase n=1 Tax=Novosphingobium terrae TaxID=2726189 RepID=UPI0019816914|nr:S24 family peptidase [Novosphingobium terrae]
MNSTDPRNRLVELARERGTSLAALSELIGRNTTYIQQFVRKGSPRKLEEGDRRTLARFFGIAESQLGGVEDKSSLLDLKRETSAWVDVPRLALDASAGPGALPEAMVVGEKPFGHFRYARRWLRGQGLDPAHLSAIAVAGDSMEPALHDGDEILVDLRPRDWGDGVHVLRLGETLLVKRLAFRQPGQVHVISENPRYAPYDLPLEEVAIIGRVVWKCGRI